MDIYFHIFISALVSLHQYIPNGNTEFEKYYQDVREVREVDILPAANQSCRFLYSVSKQAGLDSLGSGGALNSMASSLLDNSSGMDAMLGMINTPEVEQKLADRGIRPHELRQFLGLLCAEDFNPYLLPQNLASEAMQFIKSEIEVLNPNQLNSLGQFKQFGAISIYDQQGQLLDLYGSAERKWVPYQDINKSLTLSLLATEDDQFFSHDGVHPRAVARIVKEAVSADDASGGSTITMQLLKNMFFAQWPDSQYPVLNQGRMQDLLRKVREWYWAKPLEINFSSAESAVAQKEKILELYFNLVNFGRGIQGIRQASQFYFAKTPGDLTLTESAFITSLLKRPAFYADPENYVEWTKPRRDDYIIERIVQICNSPRDQERPRGALRLVDLCKANNVERVDSEALEALKAEPLPLWTPFQFTDDTGAPLAIAQAFHPTPSGAAPSGVEASDLEALQDGANEPGFADSLATEDATTLDEALYPFVTKARQKVNEVISEQPGLYKELNVQTTVRPKLQKIVYDVVRAKLDQYDNSRQARELLKPAIDDRGRRAKLRTEDLGVAFQYNIQRFTRNQWNHDAVLLYSVGLATRGRKEITLQRSEILSALETIDTQEANQLATDILIAVRATTQVVGQVVFVSITKNNFEIKTVEEMIGVMDFDSETVTEFRNYYSTQDVQNRLYKSAIDRMLRFRPRDDLKILIRTEEGELLDHELKTISMNGTDRWWAQHHAQGRTTFFWARFLRVHEGRDRYQLETPKLQAAVMIVDSHTGEVLANFAGYEAENSFFDRSSEMERPYGSSLKPWVYHLALDNGLDASSRLNNYYVEFPYANGTKIYRPRNFAGNSPAWVSLENGMVHSFNKATFSLLRHEDWDWNLSWYERFQQLRELLAQVGLYDEVENQIPIVLGAQASTLQRLVDSYTYFANGERIQKSHFVKKIEDYQGHSLYEHTPETISWNNRRSTTLFETQKLLAGVANRGTAGRLRYFTQQLAQGQYESRCFQNFPRFGEQNCFGGKTGTSNEGRDTWFTGVSRNFVIGIWVGYDDFRPIPGNATGGRLALPIFMDIVSEGIDELPEIEPFVQPSGFESSSEFNHQIFEQPSSDWNTATDSITTSILEPLNGLSRCQCQALVNTNGMVVGYKLIDPSNPSFVSETLNSIGECLQSKQSLFDSGEIRCQ